MALTLGCLNPKNLNPSVTKPNLTLTLTLTLIIVAMNPIKTQQNAEIWSGAVHSWILISWFSLSLRIASEHPWVQSAVQWEGKGMLMLMNLLLLKDWLLGLGLREMGKGCWIFSPKPVVDSNPNRTGLWISLKTCDRSWCPNWSQCISLKTCNSGLKSGNLPLLWILISWI